MTENVAGHEGCWRDRTGMHVENDAERGAQLKFNSTRWVREGKERKACIWIECVGRGVRE